jgi:hypothetical protein
MQVARFCLALCSLVACGTNVLVWCVQDDSVWRVFISLLLNG